MTVLHTQFYIVSPTYFSPSWDIIMELQRITNEICIDTKLPTSTKQFNFYSFAFYMPECFVDIYVVL